MKEKALRSQAGEVGQYPAGVFPGGMRTVPALTAVLLAVCAATAGPAQNSRVAAIDARAVTTAWEQEYTQLQKQLSGCEGCGSAKKRSSGPAGVADIDVVNRHSLIWETDRTPLDVVLRRTEALLADLKRRAPKGFPRDAQKRLGNLKRLSSGLAKTAQGTADHDLFLSACALRRSVALSNPLLDFDSIVYCRWTSTYGHVQEAWGSSVQQGTGHGIYILRGLKTGTTQIENILANSVFVNGPNQGRRFTDVSGNVRSFDLAFDAKRIVFAWANGNTLKICTVNIDGSSLTQLTSSDAYDDLDPIWLPNGRILFVSGRCETAVRCNFADVGNPTKQCVMYSMKDDGSDMTRLSYHETNERYPAVDNNGMVVYMRWDYIDRDFSAAHNIWTCYPDGRDPRAPHGNYPDPQSCWNQCPDGRSRRPFAEYFMHAIPGSQKYIAIASSHHSPPYGIPFLLDTGIKDDNAVSQVNVITPGCLPFPGEFGGYGGRDLYHGIYYERIKDECAYFDPWPLSEDYYLIPWGPVQGQVSNTTGCCQEGYTMVPMGLYLVDAFGNKELVSDCNKPNGGYYLVARPLKSRPVPPNLPTLTYDGERANSPGHTRATIGVVNVYNTDVPWPADVKAKRLRVVQVLPRPWSAPSVSDPDVGWSVGGICRASLGTVPVEDDGSVFFEAPVDRALLFQLLDEKGMATHTMRSLTYVHKGEQMQCAGCHEDKWSAVPPPTTVPRAFLRAPSKLTPDPEGTLPFAFGKLVKPVFDNKCLPCHRQQSKGLQNFNYNMDEPAHPDPNGTTRLSDYCWWFDASNNNAGEGPYGGYRSTPLEFGFAYSRLGKVLQQSHVSRITDEEMKRIMVWCDLNCMKLGTYSRDAGDIAAQENGGHTVWPPDIDPANPTGVENDRPLPGVTGIVDGLISRGLVRPDARLSPAASLSGRTCTLRNVPPGRFRVAVYNVSGRQLWNATHYRQETPGSFSFDIPTAVASSGMLFIRIESFSDGQTVCIPLAVR